MSPGTPELNAGNYAFLQDYIQRESGIALGQDKLYLLKSRLLPIVERERLASLDELCQRLRTAPTPALRRSVVEAMTTHETLFFRDPAVYDALRASIIPAIVSARKDARSMRIWSAACSSGQEPYSLAMLLLEAGLADWNIEILGTDLSTQILERAAAGSYLQIEVNRGLPSAMLVKYFQRSGLGWLVKGEVRKFVRFTQFDLRHDMRSLGAFDLVLCRNVLIYFDIDTRRKILSGIRGVLRPGGYFLMGSSETTFNLDDKFVRSTCGNGVPGSRGRGNQMSYQPGISQVTEAVFSTMLERPVSPVDRPPDDERYELTAAVYYAGAWKGALLLECSLEQAMAWGSRMGIPAPVSAEDARDSLGELCNVLAGNLKPLLPQGVGLSTPSVVKGADYTLRVCGETLCDRLHFADSSGDFRVTLVIG